MPDSDLKNLERRLAHLEDRHQLEDLVVRYFLACDERDYAALAEVFSDDAEFAGGSGRDEVVGNLQGDRDTMGATIHTPDFFLFDLEPGADTARGTIGAHCELSRGGRTLFGAMRYIDEYVRTDSGWKISKRQIKLYHVGPWEEVATSLTDELRVRWPEGDPRPADLPESG